MFKQINAVSAGTKVGHFGQSFETAWGQFWDRFDTISRQLWDSF